MPGCQEKRRYLLFFMWDIYFKKNLPNCRGGVKVEQFLHSSFFDLQSPGVDKIIIPCVSCPSLFLRCPAQKKVFENSLLFLVNSLSCIFNLYPLAGGHDLKSNFFSKAFSCYRALIKESWAPFLGNLSLINYSHKNCSS